jgi:diguanylate cyclase (GGDEF)-like protein
MQGNTIWGESPPAFLPKLTTARAVHQLTPDEAARGYPVRLRGVVTYYDPYIDPRRPALFVMDGTGSIFVSLPITPSVALRAGEQVEVTGVSGSGDFAPIVEQAWAKVMGTSHLPTRARRLTVSELQSSANDGQWVEVEGTVHSVRRSGMSIFLDVALRDGILSADTVAEAGTDYSRLVDATVKIHGNQAPTFNHQGQLTGSHLLFAGMQQLLVEEAPPGNPFDEPVDAIRTLLRYTPNSVATHRVHIRGTVTLLWPGRMICVQDERDGGSLCARTEDTSGVVGGRWRAGEMADVIGFPVIGEFTPTLLNATYRLAGGVREASVLNLTAQQALQGNHDAQLIAVEGRVIDETRTGSERTITLSSGDTVFAAVYPSQATPASLPAAPEGSLLRVTGICSVRSDGALTTAFPIAGSFRVLLDSLDNVVVLEKPSWWSAGHALWVLALALAITVAAFFGIALLRHRVKEQTAVIRAQLVETALLRDAAEFQATHDGLTGLRNRRAIIDLLQREFALASRSGAQTGVMMMDVDYFKHVNDNYGHSAGDDVLKEVARRVANAVRVSDLVGRYGGEEFLIVLPNCDVYQVQACAERIRSAICDVPIPANGAFLSLTTSLGITVAVSSQHTEKEALAAADTALYHAKACGRNRVMLADLGTNEMTKSVVSVAS